MIAPSTINAILQTSVQRIHQNFDQFDGQFPSYGDGDRTYHLTPNQNWLAAFWAGLLWLRAHHDASPATTAQAKSVLPSFAARLDKQIRLNHDIGFLFTLSARAQWQQTGDSEAREMALRAANILLGRFRTVGGYIQAWGEADDQDEAGRFIIDCLMNLPLLYWASQQTGDPRYAEAATTHAHTSATYLLRDDGTTYHTYFLDPNTGRPIGPKTHQGVADISVWARGQAWAVYGFTMAAEWTGDDAFCAAAITTANRYLQEAPPDAVSPWDYRLAEGNPVYPDSSADAIAAGGLLRLAAFTGESIYRDHAEQRLNMLATHAFDPREDAQGVLLHGTQHAPHKYGIDTYTIFGDYFFIEALMRLYGNAPDFWGPSTP